MNLTLGLLADYANKSSDGKLNILGIFNRIWSENYPAIHPEMKLVLRFDVHPAETGQPKKFQIQLRNERGAVLFELAGEMTVPAPKEPLGEMINVDQILGLTGFPLEAPGRYEFVILVNDDVKGTVPFTAALRPPQASPPAA
jgi:hypothetical protein